MMEKKKKFKKTENKSSYISIFIFIPVINIIFSIYFLIEIGENNKVKTKYSLDLNVKSKTAINIEYADLRDKKFDLILIKNTFAYLNKEEIKQIISSLNKGGILLANSFAKAPDFKVSKGDNEISFLLEDNINHFLINTVNDTISKHYFYDINIEELKSDGFKIEYYGKNSILIKYKKKE